MEYVGIQDTLCESGTPEELMDKYGLVARDVVAAAGESWLGNRATRTIPETIRHFFVALRVKIMHHEAIS